jgi:YidC/Oxa1 family membrane protein insertase
MIKRSLFVLLALFMTASVRAEFWVETETLRLSFSEQGALQSAIACFPSCSSERPRLRQFGSEGVILPDGASDNWALQRHSDDAQLDLVFRHANGAERRWRIPQRGYRIGLSLSEQTALTLRSGPAFRPRDASGFGNWLEQLRYVIMSDGDVSQVSLNDEEEAELTADNWSGFRNRFWALMALPPAQVEFLIETGIGQVDAQLVIPAAEGAWSFYLGPLENQVLGQEARDLRDILYAGLWFWLRWICFGMFYLLSWIKLLIPGWGVAIMVLSLTVHILMLPLSRIADRFQQQVNETEARLQPELQRIKRQYRGEEQAARILAMYKAERVHPLYSLKSLMGVAVVIPVFIGAFDMLAGNIHLLNTGFLWIGDLSRPDALFHLPFSLPFFGADLNLLPFLMTGLSVAASALHSPPALNAEMRRRQALNMVFLAVAFFVLFYTFPAGMVLYWTTNNLISVIKSLWARR